MENVKSVVHTYTRTTPVSVQVGQKGIALSAFLDIEDWGEEDVVLHIWDHIEGTNRGRSGRTILLDLKVLRNAITRATKGETTRLSCKAQEAPGHDEYLMLVANQNGVIALRVDEPNRPGPSFVLPVKVLRRALSGLVQAVRTTKAA